MMPRVARWLWSVVLLTACRTSASPPPPAALEKAPVPLASPNGAPAQPSVVAEPDRPGFAVVELFTSEGCSSCPAADDVLAEIAATEQSRSVYALAFHVDYWDDLGWKDRFSSPASTERQHGYAASFRSRRVYTPQLVINGTSEFTGSERARARRVIDAALERAPSMTRLALRLGRDDGRGVEVRYAVTGAPAGSVLHLALVDREGTSVVAAGENAGRTLHHARVVRSFVTVDGAIDAGARTLTRSESGASDVIGYVQSRSPGPAGGLAIWAAARATR